MITFFTPTYNREKYLPLLKASLDKQTSKNFEWIIVDDGSTDNTETLVHSWNADYKIRYIKQTNQGKHMAYNNGVKNATYEWFVCVDSDDTVAEDAVESIEKSLINLPNSFSGVVSPQKKSDNSVEKNWKKIDGKSIDIMDLRDLYGIKESGIVLRVDRIRKYPFPKFDNERFLPESWLYQKLVKEGPFLAYDHPFYIGDYLADGLTNNIWMQWKKNPDGVLCVLKEKYYLVNKYKFYKRWLTKSKITVNISSLCMAINRKYIDEVPSKTMGMIWLLASLYFYKKRYR